MQIIKLSTTLVYIGQNYNDIRKILNVLIFLMKVLTKMVIMSVMMMTMKMRMMMTTVMKRRSPLGFVLHWSPLVCAPTPANRLSCDFLLYTDNGQCGHYHKVMVTAIC